MPQVELWPSPERHIAPMPRDPIDKEKDVPAFLLHHGFECFNQLRREEAGAAAASNRPKAKKLSMHSL